MHNCFFFLFCSMLIERKIGNHFHLCNFIFLEYVISLYVISMISLEYQSCNLSLLILVPNWCYLWLAKKNTDAISIWLVLCFKEVSDCLTSIVTVLWIFLQGEFEYIYIYIYILNMYHQNNKYLFRIHIIC